MKCDCLIVGVGGQGVLSIASVIAQSAVKSGFLVRQSEVHGMAQRGGAVLAHLRLAELSGTLCRKSSAESSENSQGIAGDFVPRGEADLIISMEPLESLRYLSWLSPHGMVVSSADAMINIPNYPEKEKIENAVKSLPKSMLINAEKLAKEAGLLKTVNMVMVGASSPFLPISPEILESTIIEIFTGKDPKLADLNKKAFILGCKASHL